MTKIACKTWYRCISRAAGQTPYPAERDSDNEADF